MATRYIHKNFVPAELNQYELLNCEKLDCKVYEQLAELIVSLHNTYHSIEKNLDNYYLKNLQTMSEKVNEIYQLVSPAISADGLQLLNEIKEFLSHYKNSISKEDVSENFYVIHTLIMKLRDKVNDCYKENKCEGHLNAKLNSMI